MRDVGGLLSPVTHGLACRLHAELGYTHIGELLPAGEGRGAVRRDGRAFPQHFVGQVKVSLLDHGLLT